MKDLTEKAMLVRLNISQWTARKHDKEATKAVETQFNAHDVGRFHKVLIAQEAIKVIQKVSNEARTYHYEKTLPWDDSGNRILTVGCFAEYSENMRKLRAKFEQVVNDFVDNYPALVQDAKQKLNGLFKESDYPQNVKRLFDYNVSINPLPLAADFRVSLQSNEVKEIQAEIEANTTKALQAAHQDIYRRLYETVGHMVEKLKDTKAIFRDSLITNLVDLCNLIPKLNIVEDINLDAIRQAIEQSLTNIQPDTLRENEFARKEVADNGDAILSAIGAMYESK